MLLWIASALADPTPGPARLHDPLTTATGEVFDGPAGLIDEPQRLNAEVDPGLLVGAGSPGVHAVGALWSESWTLVAAASADVEGNRNGSTANNADDTQTLESASERDLALGVAGSWATAATALGASVYLRSRHQFATLAGDPLAPELGANATVEDTDQGLTTFTGNGGGVAANLTTVEARLAATRASGSLRPSGGLGVRVETDAAHLDYTRLDRVTANGTEQASTSTSLVGPDPFGLLGANPNTRRLEGELRCAVDQGGTLRDPTWRGALGARVGLLRPAEKELVWTETVDGEISEATHEVRDAGGYGVTAWMGGFRQLGDPPVGRVRVGAWLTMSQDTATWNLRRTDGLEFEETDLGATFGTAGPQGDRAWSSWEGRLIVPVASEVQPGSAWTLRAGVVPFLDVGGTTRTDEDWVDTTGNVDVGASTHLGLAWRSPGGVGASLVWSGYASLGGIDLDNATLWVSWAPPG